MPLYLLDNTLRVEVCYEQGDQEYRDNICLQIIEECPADEKVMVHDESNLYLTVVEAHRLAEMLLAAAAASEAAP